MADALCLLVLRKVAFSLGERTIKELSSEVVEAATVLADVEGSMKQVESEFTVMQAFISKVITQKAGEETFDAWLDQVRSVAREVEDIVDEYAYLTSNVEAGKTNFFKRRFRQSKNIAAWHNIASQFGKVETRIQRLNSMRDRYDISIADRDRNNKLDYTTQQLAQSDAAYLTDENEIVGNAAEIRRLTEWLTDEKQDRVVMSICGMGGLGKTTLASSVYKRKDIRMHFDCYAWVTVSQSYQVEDLVRSLTKQLRDKNVNFPAAADGMDRVHLIEALQSYLQNKRYLIVLDDVWDRDAWAFLNRAFPKNSSGSRVVLTTRSKVVASLADQHREMELQILPEAEAWNLFCRKAFWKLKAEDCPDNLREWAQKIVEKCQGLPLAIVAVGSLLSYKMMEEHEWKSFYNQLSWQMTNNSELSWVANVLNMSFNDLPSNLKNCFLHCSLFPEDFKIKRKLVIRLWIAEGFVEETGNGTTLEEVANCYLMELAQRSLLQVVERNAYGRGKVFQMHDVVREILLSIAKKEKFAVSYNNSDAPISGDEARRVSIQEDSGSVEFGEGSPKLRSVLSFKNASSSWIDTASSNFRLLRILCLRFTKMERVPDAVSELYNLHYLDFAYTKVKQIPKSVGKLKNVQTLDLRCSCVMELPREVTMLSKLRYLHVTCYYDEKARDFDNFSATVVPSDICQLKHLQALGTVGATKELVSQIGDMELMRNLFIMKMKRNYLPELWASLLKMPKLKKLGLVANSKDEVLDLRSLKPLPNLERLFLRGKLEKGVVPPVFASFGRLSHLKMGWSGLQEDPLGSFAHMFSLVELHLDRVYDGHLLTFRAGWFPNLKNLHIADMEDLSTIDIKDGAMKNLCRLELIGLKNLMAIPEGIKYLRSLQEMILRDVSKDFIETLIRGGNTIVQHVPNIYVIQDLIPSVAVSVNNAPESSRTGVQFLWQ